MIPARTCCSNGWECDGSLGLSGRDRDITILRRIAAERRAEELVRALRDAAPRTGALRRRGCSN
jgi:hypothetical protein